MRGQNCTTHSVFSSDSEEDFGSYRLYCSYNAVYKLSKSCDVNLQVSEDVAELLDVSRLLNEVELRHHSFSKRPKGALA